MEKKCFKCGLSKPMSDFYSHPKMADRHLGKCKECTKGDSKRRYWEKHDEVTAYEKSRMFLPHRVRARREYLNTEKGKDVRRKAIRQYAERYPDKHIAHIATANAIRDGRLKRSPCEVCGEAKSEAHHDDYSQPLSVRWLCKRHHMEWHRNNVAKCQPPTERVSE